MIEQVTEKTLPQAAKIHSLSWQASHATLCTPDFIALHTLEHQAAYLRKEMGQGKELFLLSEEEPIAIVAVWRSLIENLYVLPDKQQHGYGTLLLQFAIAKCTGVPTLWVLNTNAVARRVYEKNGFRATGNAHVLNESLYEIEMFRPGHT